MDHIAATEAVNCIHYEEDVIGQRNQLHRVTKVMHTCVIDPSHSTQDNQMEEDPLPQLHVPKLKFMIPSTPSVPCSTLPFLWTVSGLDDNPTYCWTYDIH